MTADELRKLMPRASESFIRANADHGPDRPRQIALLEPDTRDAALATSQVQTPTPEKFLVRVTSVRRRLLDEDNLCAKYHVDCLRYAGILPADDPSKTSIQVSQRKAAKGEPEHTLIEVERIG